MRSTFFGIETMRKALLTQRRVMDTIGHNVANASTEGYSRQKVTLTPTNPYAYPNTSSLYGAGQIGTGVVASQIERIRDVFVDSQLRLGTTNKGQVEVEKNTLTEIENVFMEPSTDSGLNSVLSAFFASWQELSKRPDVAAVRDQVISSAQDLVDVIHNIDQTLRQMRVDLNGQLNKDVEQVNNILKQIAELNPEIAKVYSTGDTPNDLMDKRDMLLDELSQYLNYQVHDSEYEGGMVIEVGGRELIRNDRVYDLTLEPNWDHPSQNTKTPYMNDVSQDDYYMLSQFSSGELRGVINSRDEIIPEVQQQFTELVNTIVNTVNNAHSQGLGVSLESQNILCNTTAAIVSGANYAQINPTDAKAFSIGDDITITDAQGESISVKITDIQTVGANSRLYFDNIGILAKSQYNGLTYSLTQFTNNGIDTGATIRNNTLQKNNFFNTVDLLQRSYVGDTDPD
ncbi:MAG TPA: flagellar hook-associated protein FlgK, partial [bacterium]|nr:flagellar hook-associated protein FlgK [bacterium]